MGVAGILERVVRTTSRDEGDVTRVGSCSSPRSSQAGDYNSVIHDPEVQLYYRQDPNNILAPPCSARKVGDFAFRFWGIRSRLSKLPLRLLVHLL